MAVPINQPHTIVRPQRVYDFAAFSRRTPTAQPPGDRLDAQFQNLIDATNALAVRLEGMRKPLALDDLDPALVNDLVARLRVAIAEDALVARTAAQGVLTGVRIAGEQAQRAEAAAASSQAVAAQAAQAVVEARRAAEDAAQILQEVELRAEVPPNTPLEAFPRLGPNAGGFYAADVQGATNTSADYAQVAIEWAEHMPDTIPPNILAINAVTGDHWSSRWWANRTASIFGGATVWFYFGAFPSPPSTTPTGEPLAPGMIYYDTSQGVMMVWSGSIWTPMAQVQVGVAQRLVYVATQGQTVFNLSTPDYYGQTGQIKADIGVYRNGLLLAPDDGTGFGGFTANAAAETITLVMPAGAGEIVEVTLANPVSPTAGVASFNNRAGVVALTLADVQAVGAAPLASPAFTGTPTAPTAAPGTNTTQLATTAFVAGAMTASGVASFNARTGAVTLTTADVTGAGGYAASNPAGYQTAAQVTASLGPYALASSLPAASSSNPAMDGTASPGAAAAFARGDHVHPVDASRAPLASPAFTGSPTAPTPGAADNSANVATTAFVAASYAPLASPALTGNPVAPTAALNANTTQIATTAFVLGQGAAALPNMDGTASIGVSNRFARGDHVHPTDSSRAPLASPTFTGTVTIPAGASIAGFAPLASPTFTGVPAAPTATAGTNTTQVATTAFVQGGYLPLPGGTLTGPLTLTGAVPQVTLAPSAAGSCQLALRKSGSTFNNIFDGNTGAGAAGLRWRINHGDPTAEGGSNAGSNWSLQNYSDTGTGLQTVMSCVRSTGVVTFAQTIVNGSDARWKERVEPIKGALALVERLTGVSFRRKGYQEKRIGLIAQDVRAVLPEVVHEGLTTTVDGVEYEKPLGVAYVDMVAVLIEAVKELSAKVATLERAR